MAIKEVLNRAPKGKKGNNEKCPKCGSTSGQCPASCNCTGCSCGCCQ